MAISKTVRAKLKLHHRCCWYCGTLNPNTVDHITPISKGGGDDTDNLVLACKSCNSRKRDLTINQFRFHVSWGKTQYSKHINAISAKSLMRQGVSFDNFTNDHVFWFEGV